MKTIGIALCATLFVAAAAIQDPQFDNSKLQPFIGEWTGTATMAEESPSPSTIKGTKVLADRWVKLDLKFDTEGHGKIEATAMLTTDSNGVVGGYFFASLAAEPLFGKGKFTDKKLTIAATSLDGGESLEFVFDLSVADELKFSLSETEQEKVTVMSGTYKKKKA
ncbi:MAG: hypothetical protein M3R13_00810 [Armatimonadota bacterium]|nr:hypothetical protein [Armatimonadota bacterium]